MYSLTHFFANDYLVVLIQYGAKIIQKTQTILKKPILFAFFILYYTFLPVFGQETLLLDSTMAPLLDWQEQILQQVDIEELGDAAYQDLLEELDELVLWSDTTQQSHLPQRLRQHAIFSLNRTLNQREGYRAPSEDKRLDNKSYLGDPLHTSVRYRLKAGSEWQTGFSLEKDAGEAWRRQFPSFDSWHGFVLYQGNTRSRRWLRRAVVGHYQLRMGCGLVLNQGFSLGKQFLLQQFHQRSNTFSPYASTAESGYLQGMALQINLGTHFTILPYVSALQIDGTLTEQHILTSLKTDGLHRTYNEANKRNAAWQSLFGTRLGWRGEWYDFGIHLTTTHLQYNYYRNPTYYNENYFRGHQLTHLSADYNVRAYGFTLRGELAFDDQGGAAALNIISHRLSRYWTSSLCHRLYSPQYRQLHASSLKESTSMQGEQGLTLSAEGNISRYWSMQLMADWFLFSTPQYGMKEASSQGGEGLVRINYQKKQNVVNINYRIKRKADYIRHSFDANHTFSASNGISLRSLVKGRIYSEKAQYPSYGYAISEALSWEGVIGRQRSTLNLQATFFQSDDYDSRLYVTEKNILYGVSLPMLYGKGLRYSLTANQQLGNCTLEFKWALTNYANRNTISSGLQLIQGNNQQDLWIQLRIKL